MKCSDNDAVQPCSGAANTRRNEKKRGLDDDKNSAGLALSTGEFFDIHFEEQLFKGKF